MSKRTATTKDIGLVHQLVQEGQLQLAPEFQRNSVWPRSAKAYLIDTILCDRPMPLFFLQRSRSAQSGRTAFTVVDGQQRLRAIFEFLDDRFALTESKSAAFKNKRYSQLNRALQDRILNYDLTVQELAGYSESDIRNIFVRMNRFVVKLSPQELRHARETGKFYDFVEKLGRNTFWTRSCAFTIGQQSRMKTIEFSAELAILLIEGPQDKKSSIDLYYREYQQSFPFAREVEAQLSAYLSWIESAIPALKKSRFRKPTDLYSLIGALVEFSQEGRRKALPDPKLAGRYLDKFEKDLVKKAKDRVVVEYLAASGRQTDNLAPREQRIGILKTVLSGAR